MAKLKGSSSRATRSNSNWSPPKHLPKIPTEWAWCAVEEAGEVQLGRQRAPQHHSGDHLRPYLRVANVLEDRLDLSDVKQMNFDPEECKTFSLRVDDVLLNEGQAPDLLGRPAMYRGEIEGCCFQKNIAAFHAKEGVDPAFALLVFRYYMHSGRFKRESRITTNIGHLTQASFVLMEFPLPGEVEQRVIVERYKQLEPALPEFDAEAADAARLRQFILKAAFEGRHVPQDPADEPAAAMLARRQSAEPSSARSAVRRKRELLAASLIYMIYF